MHDGTLFTTTHATSELQRRRGVSSGGGWCPPKVGPTLKTLLLRGDCKDAAQRESEMRRTLSPVAAEEIPLGLLSSAQTSEGEEVPMLLLCTGR